MSVNHQPQLLLFVLDTTGSMGSWVQALVKILPEVVDTATLTGAFDAVGILEYGDYDLPERYPVQFSGWGTVTSDAKTLFKPAPPSRTDKDMPDWHKNPSHTMDEVVKFAKTRVVRGGGGCPEAVKTAMYATVNICRETLYGFDEEDGSEAVGRCPFVHMVQLTDAPMHDARSLDNEGKKESSLLGAANLDGPIVFNRLLVGLRHQLRYSCLCSARNIVSYSHLAAVTGGFSIVPPSVTVDVLRKELQGLIAGWMGALPKDKESVATGPNQSLVESNFECELRALAADASKQLAQLKYIPVVLEAATSRSDGLLAKLMGGNGEQYPFVPKIDTSGRAHLFQQGTVGTEAQLHTAGKSLAARDANKGPLPPVAALATKLKQSVRRMKTDAAFVDDMAPTLKRICGESPMALCGNDVMGAMWRAFCTRREDPRRDEYLQLLDKAKNALSAGDKATFEAWNKRSYNVGSEIRKFVQDFAAKKGVVGVVRFEGDSEGFVPQSVNEAFLSLKREGLQAVSEVLSRLQIDREFRMSAAEASALGNPAGSAEGGSDDEADDDEQPTALAANVLPLNMPVEDLFRHLLHIAIPGSRLSRRPAALLAVCAVRTGCVVKAEAAAYLEEIKGKWIDWRRRKDLGQKVATEEDGNTPVVQENYNGAFMRLVRSVEGVLTDAERETTHYMQRISAVLGYDRSEVKAVYLDTQSADGCFPDHVSQCGCCRATRPLSLLKDDAESGLICGYCLRARTEAGQAKFHADTVLGQGERVHSSQKVLPVPEQSQSESQMQARCVKCTGFYARNKQLRITTDSNCHYCQFGLAPSTVECAKCKHLIVSPGGRALPGGVCGPCAGGVAARKVATETKPLAMRILFPRAQAESLIVAAAGLVRTDGAAAGLIPAGTSLPDAALMFDQAASMTEAEVGEVSEVPPNPYTTATPQLQRDPVVQATHMRHMLNEDALWERVVKSVRLTGRVGVMPTCMMCCGDFQPDKMSRTCGRKGCEQRMCMACLGEWYGKSVPGKAVVPRSLLCPCCGRTPAPSVLRKGNRDALQVRLYQQCHEFGVGGERVEGTYNSGMQPGEAMTKVHFAWCGTCMKVVNHADRTCDGFDPDEIVNYRCEECVLATTNGNVDMAKVKECPGCTAPTVRIGGCAHITCTQCQQHWCYLCGEGFATAGEVYGHMETHEDADVWEGEDDADEYDE